LGGSFSKVVSSQYGELVSRHKRRGPIPKLFYLSKPLLR
jgi:hypothetical protein